MDTFVAAMRGALNLRELEKLSVVAPEKAKALAEAEQAEEAQQRNFVAESARAHRYYSVRRYSSSLLCWWLFSFGCTSVSYGVGYFC